MWSLFVQSRHRHLGIAQASRCAFGSGLVDACQVVRRELDVDGGEVLLQIFAAPGAGDGR